MKDPMKSISFVPKARGGVGWVMQRLGGVGHVGVGVGHVEVGWVM